MKSRLWRPRGRRRTAKPTPRPDAHVTDQAPVQIGISPQMPGSMPRAEDDAATRERSPAFHDQPGSGKDRSIRYFYF